MLGGGHEPRAWVVRDARLRPLLECGDESILCEVLGETDVTHDPRKTCDELGRLDPPNRFDGAMPIGSRHGYPSHHLQFPRASRGAPRLFLRGHLGAQALLLLLELGSELGTEVRRLEHLANLDLGLVEGGA